LAAAGSSCAAFAANAAQEEPRWYLQVDNDVLFGTDRWYTSGVRVARVAPRGDHEIEWGLTQEVYTPEGKRFAPGTLDRAPVGRLLLSGARHDTGESQFQTIELSLGVRGRGALGRRTTEAVHYVVPSPFVDWEREEGTRVDAMAAIARSHRFGNVSLHYGGVAGSARTFVHAGAQLNLGPALYSPVMRFAATAPPAGAGASWSAFVGASGRAVVNDHLVERGYDASLIAPAHENFVGRIAVGLGTVRHWGSISLTAAMDTREFEGQRVAHRFGSLMVHFDF